MKVSEREAVLRRLVDEYREQECKRLLQRAQERAARLLRRTYRRVRQQLHQRVLEERARARERLRAAAAEQETRRRRQRELADCSLLDVAWPRLHERLLEEWQRPAVRRRWIARYVDEALQRFPHHAWTLYHPPGWPAGEQRWVSSELCAGLSEPPQFKLDSTLRAGIVIASGGMRLDASARGLLTDRERLQARLLALVKEATAA